MWLERANYAYVLRFWPLESEKDENKWKQIGIWSMYWKLLKFHTLFGAATHRNTE